MPEWKKQVGLLSLYLCCKQAGADLGAYLDKSDLADYALDSAGILVKAGVVGGKSNKLVPTGTLSRAEAAVILYRTLKQ